MLETFISIALYFGAFQEENITSFDRSILLQTEDSAGFFLNEIPPSEDYIIREENSIFIIELLGQDQNGAGN